MKAALAGLAMALLACGGLARAAPPPLVAWDEVQQLAQTVAADPQAAQHSSSEDELGAADRLTLVLGLATPLVNLHQSVERASVLAAGFARAIRLPGAAPSLFKSSRDIAGLQDDTPTLALRLGVAYRTVPDAQPLPIDGGWVAHGATTRLARPVARTTLFRDGRLSSTPSLATRRRIDWGEADPPMCYGYVGGFAFGDADARLWAGDTDRAQQNTHPKGSLVVIHTRRALPAAAVRMHKVSLDRAATGFVRATQWRFDLDADGRPDLVAIEAVGNGPGHLDGPAGTDDAWYRLFVVNIAGRWHVLGHDVFSYGCGC